MTSEHTRWADVEPLPELNGDLQSVLDAVRSLQQAWGQVVSTNTEAFHEARRRSLRRHAIETGIIERLYEVDWGVTQALVAEGITADAVARAQDGSVPVDVLRTIQTQYEALEFLADSARDGRELSISLIRELHVALTHTQKTYTARSTSGLLFDATLHHGQWKQQPNHVTRADGSQRKYTPPEQVPPQMERLIELYRQYQDSKVDPIIREAWLHHRFVRIHPFEDGNGRVARCLTLLGLLRANLAPLVVDRRERDRYLSCLDAANEGDLRPLIRFFAELEIVALRSELEQPVLAEQTATARGADAVLEAGIARLQDLQRATGATERARQTEALATGIQQRVESWLKQAADRFERNLRDGLDPDAHVLVTSAAPPDPQARWWRRQVVETANSVDFYANIHAGVWWTQLRLRALDTQLRYLVFLQKVGRGETGVLTLTTYAELASDSPGEDPRPEPEPVVVSSPTETVTWTYTEQPEAYWDAVTHLLDGTLAQALSGFTARLG